MKIHRVLAAALCLFAVGALCAAPNPRITISFDHPENFKDAKDASGSTDSTVSTLQHFLSERADHYLPEGYRFAMTFTNIDLAGEFEPWRGPRWSSVRFIKDIYPPDYSFTYMIYDPAGGIVAHGAEHVREMNYMQLYASSVSDSDSLHYDKAVLDHWLQEHLGRLRNPL